MVGVLGTFVCWVSIYWFAWYHRHYIKKYHPQLQDYTSIAPHVIKSPDSLWHDMYVNRVCPSRYTLSVTGFDRLITEIRTRVILCYHRGKDICSSL